MKLYLVRAISVCEWSGFRSDSLLLLRSLTYSISRRTYFIIMTVMVHGTVFFFFSLCIFAFTWLLLLCATCARAHECVCVSIQRLCRLILLKEVGFVIVIHNRQKLLQITVNAHSSKHSRLFIFIYNIRMAGEKGYALAFAFDLMVKLFFFCCVASSLSSSVPAIESIYYGRFVSMTSAPHNRTPLA